MIQAAPAPKPLYKRFIFVPYAYAGFLVLLALTQLMGVGGFDFAFIEYETPGLPVLVVTIAGLEIFALPFVLRLRLSRLARFLSATFSLMAPLFLCANLLYLISLGIVSVNFIEIAGSIAFVALGIASFVILSGQQALTLSNRA